MACVLAARTDDWRVVKSRDRSLSSRWSRLDCHLVGSASLVESPKLTVDDGDPAVVLDPDLPVGRLGNAAEPTPVNDEPLVDAGGARPLHLLGTGTVGLHQPIDVLRAEPLGVVDVQLASSFPLGLFPVDLLPSGLDHVQVEVGISVPKKGKLRVSNLYRDAPDDLSPFAESGQAEAVSVAGSGVFIK